MNDFFVCKIHNNSLGSSFKVMSYDDGIDDITEWAEDFVQETFNRNLTQDERDSIVENGEYYNDEDSDNIYTFSIGVLA